MRTKTILTYGTFDLFHHGHERLLMRARALGDRLIVGCSTDAFNRIKGKESAEDYATRRAMLLRLPYVDQVFAEENWDQKPDDIRRFNADVFVMGDDWAGEFDWLQDLVTVQYLPRTEGISSTLLRARDASVRI